MREQQRGESGKKTEVKEVIREISCGVLKVIVAGFSSEYTGKPLEGFRKEMK